MALAPYNTNLLQALKWQQNNAPNINLIVQQKANWYQQFQAQFWQDWEKNVFDLRTANNFGLLIWCIILGVPSQLFGLFGNTRSWAYGPTRQNYVWSGTGTPPPDENIIGGNFAGGGSSTVLNPQEARWALQLRYAALVSNGRISFINFMLNWIFNGGLPWDYASGKYFYVADDTVVATSTPISVAAIADPFVIEYRIGNGMNFSAQFVNLLNSPQFGVAPQFAGSKYTVIVEP